MYWLNFTDKIRSSILISKIFFLHQRLLLWLWVQSKNRLNYNLQSVQYIICIKSFYMHRINRRIKIYFRFKWVKKKKIVINTISNKINYLSIYSTFKYNFSILHFFVFIFTYVFYKKNLIASGSFSFNLIKKN